MSVRITTPIPAYAGGTSTDGTIELVLINQTPQITISNVTGLSDALTAKLNDTEDQIGHDHVTVHGADLNLLTGMADYGLESSDFERLADIEVSAEEINHLQGIADDLTTLLSSRPSYAEFQNDNDIFISLGKGKGNVEPFGDVLGEYSINDLGMPTDPVDFNGQRLTNVGDPDDDQDVATKAYVQSVISNNGSFLALDGSTSMTGDIDLDGNRIILDADGDSMIITGDDTMLIRLGGEEDFNFSLDGFDLDSKRITNLADPTDAQDAATKNYVDTNFYFLGDINLDGNYLFLDSDFDSYIRASFDDVINIGTGGQIRFAITNDYIDVNGLPIVALSDPTDAQDAATKNYVDTNFLALDGTGELTGDLDIGGHTLMNPADPSAGTHVGDRDYNDNRYLRRSNNLSDLTNLGNARTNLGLATVASSGDYDDLDNKPSIPVTLADIGVNIGTPSDEEHGYVIAWDNEEEEFALLAPSVLSVFGRTGEVVGTSGDYSADLITFESAESLSSTDVAAALDELDITKLSLIGGTMSGNIDMDGNDISGVGELSVGNHVFASDTYTSASEGNSFLIRTTATPTASTPTYSFATDADSGMYWNGSGISISVNGSARLSIGTSAIDANALRVANVANPTSAQDAVTVNYLNGLGVVHVLGAKTGVNLLTGAGTATAIYTVPTGQTHIIKEIVVVATSYTPGATPTDPVISVGITSPDYDEILESVPVSWGAGGAADQAVYLDAKQGASTPNANDVVYVQKDVVAGGSFSALTVDVYVLGYIT